MIINRHNYEEFFLLYTDNELKDTERAAVENFVKQNADLAKELEMLQQSTLANEDIVFAQKELLYRKETGISLNNYEEYFLLSIDNELNTAQNDELSKFILKNPELEKEFTLLKQTKLEPEIVAFAGKETLYRTTKQRRIIPVAWMRMSAAAAIIALVSMTWMYIQNNGSVAKNNVYTIAEKPVNKPAEINNQPLVRENVKGQPGDTFNRQSEIKNNIKNIDIAKDKTVNTKKIRKPQETVAFKNPENNIKKKATTADNNIAFEETKMPEKKYETPVEVTIKKENSTSNIISEDKNKPVYASNEKLEEPALVVHALYHEINTDEEDKSVFIGGADINKNKLKGLFKKAAAFLEKKSRRNENE